MFIGKDFSRVCVASMWVSGKSLWVFFSDIGVYSWSVNLQVAATALFDLVWTTLPVDSTNVGYDPGQVQHALGVLYLPIFPDATGGYSSPELNQSQETFTPYLLSRCFPSCYPEFFWDRDLHPKSIDACRNHSLNSYKNGKGVLMKAKNG